MTITKRKLHDLICEYVPEFEDADLFHSNEEIEVSDGTSRRLKEYQNGSYLSIDDPQGHEIYYAE
jgi:hypothetical protein